MNKRIAPSSCQRRVPALCRSSAIKQGKIRLPSQRRSSCERSGNHTKSILRRSHLARWLSAQIGERCRMWKKVRFVVHLQPASFLPLPHFVKLSTPTFKSSWPILIPKERRRGRVKRGGPRKRGRARTNAQHAPVKLLQMARYCSQLTMTYTQRGIKSALPRLR